MSAKYSGPDDWTLFHIADDEGPTYKLKNPGSDRHVQKTRSTTSSRAKPSNSNKQASSSSQKQGSANASSSKSASTASKSK